MQSPGYNGTSISKSRRVVVVKHTARGITIGTSLRCSGNTFWLFDRGRFARRLCSAGSMLCKLLIFTFLLFSFVDNFFRFVRSQKLNARQLNVNKITKKHAFNHPSAYLTAVTQSLLLNTCIQCVCAGVCDYTENVWDVQLHTWFVRRPTMYESHT